jgi:hypothetical protein
MNWLDEPRPERILLAGVELARRVPVHRAPGWVGGVIESLSPLFAPRSWREHIERVVVVCRTEAMWTQARTLFDELRAARLSSADTISPMPSYLFELLELGCKVSHNASGITPTFDMHVTTRVLGLARAALDDHKADRTESRVASVERALLAEVRTTHRHGLLSWER